MTKFKMIISGLIAAATMASLSVSAFANGKSDDWAIDYTSGAPSSLSIGVVECELYYYTGGYQTTCTSFDGGGDGYIGVYVRGTERWKITGTDTVPRNGYTVSDSDRTGDKVIFSIRATGSRVTGSGTIQQK